MAEMAPVFSSFSLDLSNESIGARIGQLASVIDNTGIPAAAPDGGGRDLNAPYYEVKIILFVTSNDKDAKTCKKKAMKCYKLGYAIQQVFDEITGQKASFLAQLDKKNFFFGKTLCVTVCNADGKSYSANRFGGGEYSGKIADIYGEYRKSVQPGPGDEGLRARDGTKMLITFIDAAGLRGMADTNDDVKILKGAVLEKGFCMGVIGNSRMSGQEIEDLRVLESRLYKLVIYYKLNPLVKAYIDGDAVMMANNEVIDRDLVELPSEVHLMPDLLLKDSYIHQDQI